MLMNYKVSQLVLAFATGIGAFGGFPEPPAVFKEAIKNELVQWALVFVLLYQGGAGQDVKLALLVTAAMYAGKQVLA